MNFSYILCIHLTWFVEYIHFFLLILILKNIYFLKLNVNQYVLEYQIMFFYFYQINNTCILHGFTFLCHVHVFNLYSSLPGYSKPLIDPLILTLIISLINHPNPPYSFALTFWYHKLWVMKYYFDFLYISYVL